MPGFRVRAGGDGDDLRPRHQRPDRRGSPARLPGLDHAARRARTSRAGHRCWSTSPTPPEVVSACDDASVLWVESPTNPALEVADLPALCAAAHAAGASVVVRQHVRDAAAAATARPRCRCGRALGDRSIYLSGHADVVLGAVVTRDDQAWRGTGRATPRPYTVRSRACWRPGSRCAACARWRCVVDRAEANAQELARRLGEHPAVAPRCATRASAAIVAIELALGRRDGGRPSSPPRRTDAVGARHQSRQRRVDAPTPPAVGGR